MFSTGKNSVPNNYLNKKKLNSPMPIIKVYKGINWVKNNRKHYMC